MTSLDGREDVCNFIDIQQDPPSNLMPFARPTLLAVALVLCCPPALADPDTGCPLPRRNVEKTPRMDDRAPIEARASNVRMEKGGFVELEGSAELSQSGNRIAANRLRYDKSTGTAQAQGNAQFQDASGDSFYTEQFRIDLDTHQGEIGPGHYRLRNNSARGETAGVELRGREHTRLNDVTYTTCQEGQDDWFLNVDELNLDHAEDIGTAWYASVDFLGVPIFYFPYLSFPLGDQRKSGFLFPRVGYSEKHGTDISAPYYLNLAPNYDATVTPRILSKRGLQLQNQFRYMMRDSEGVLELEALPSDNEYNNDRVAGLFQHQQTFDGHWAGNIDARYVSDKQYFGDFGDRLSLTSQSFVPQTADLTYRGSSWTFITRAADHQTVTEEIAPFDRPYARLPQVQLASAGLPLPNRLYPQFETEWNHFEHDHAQRVAGERLNLNTGVSLPLENVWGFVTPKIGARYIGYRLDRGDATPSVGRGVLSLDSGAFFERETQWGDRATVQTLEPRLFYLYVPKKDQDALPNFDTGLPDFSFAALFRENRFNGGDRIADANQLTAALTARWLDTEEGIERLRLSIGRIFYFDDPQVNLPAGVRHRDASDIVAEANAWLIGNWHLRETLQWNTDSDRIERSSAYLQYNPARNKIFNLGYIYLRDQIGEIDASTEWPLVGRWSLRARSLYSTQFDRNTESYAGFEYNACCWALRVLAGRRYQASGQNDEIMLELQLNGLSELGRVPDRPSNKTLFFTADDADHESRLR
ncbi:MAG TPA: LPS-assembly protein LptD [Burkholderiales bacterium]|nr:LPS-assembly protein LptD [Burkholderiales bacterium]